jgi:transcription termination/antitermination protein NusG
MDSGEWFALTVRPQHEKKSSFSLRNTGIEEYLPLYRSRRQWSDRQKDLDLPLFPGYVFARFSLDRKVDILRTPGVVNIVGFGGPTPIPGHEIASVRALIDSGGPILPWPAVKVGSTVQICRGSMDGVIGVLTAEKGVWRVVVNVNLLQRGVAVEIDREWVRPISAAA